MRNLFSILVSAWVTSLLINPLSFAKEPAEECSIDFKDLLRWRVKTILIGQESKYKSDCMIEIKRKELLHPSLSPKCHRVLFRGSSLDQDSNLKDAIDNRGVFFKKADKEKLLDIHYRISASTLDEARSKCNDKPMSPD